MIVQNVSAARPHRHLLHAAQRGSQARPDRCWTQVAATVGAPRCATDDDIAKVSLVGAGMKTHPGVAAEMFDALADAGINIEMISTSSIRISCVVRASEVERAVQVVHERFELSGRSREQHPRRHRSVRRSETAVAEQLA